jgi:hypothetical protein
MDYPFISTDGGANRLVKVLKVRVSDQEFMPAILEVSNGTLSVDSVYIGRGPGQYFEDVLFKRLIDERCKQEYKGIIYSIDTRELINQLKRRAIKCQEGNLASAWLSWHSNLPQPVAVPEEETSQIQKRFDDLPPELVEIILSYCLDISSLVKASRTCRAFYIAVCNVLIMRLRNQMACLKPALPDLNYQVIYCEKDLADESLDRWSGGHSEGIAYRDLCKRVSDTQNLLVQTSQFTRQWSPRRMKKYNEIN